MGQTIVFGKSDRLEEVYAEEEQVLTGKRFDMISSRSRACTFQPQVFGVTGTIQIMIDRGCQQQYSRKMWIEETKRRISAKMNSYD